MKTTGLSTWQGTWKGGSGTISTTSATLRSEPYTFSSRFTPGTPGASPEELLAAAHVGCFNQALANNSAIIGVLIVCSAKVPGISKEDFDYCAERAQTHCTIAKLMRVDTQMSATLLT